MDNEILQIWKDIKKWLSSTYYTVGFFLAIHALYLAKDIEGEGTFLVKLVLFIGTWVMWLPVWISEQFM
jgi:hypothetical protein